MALILSGDTGPSFVQSAAMPTGSVIQVQTTTININYYTASSTYQATTLTVNITPKFSTSKFIINAETSINLGAGSGPFQAITICRNGTNIGQAIGMSQTNFPGYWLPCSITCTDTPGTTSTLTYAVYIKSTNNASNVYIGGDSGTSTIFVMEIQG